MSARIRGPIAVGIAVASLLLAQPAAANGWDICGQWTAGAHALYLTPIACPHAYASAIVLTAAPNVTSLGGQAAVIPCRADWGFRVFGNYDNDCLFAALSYQWFEVTTTRSISGENVRLQGSTNGGAGRATGQTGIEYQNVDVRVGQSLLRGCGVNLYWYGNARWIDLSYRRSARIVFSTANFFPEDVQEKSQLEGSAIGIGFGGELDVWCNFGAFVDGNVLGVIGNRSLRNVRFRGFQQGPSLMNFPIERQESYPSETCVIPEVNFRIGISYTYVCGCWELVGELGYEVDYFWHASVFPDLASNNMVLNSRDFVPVCEDLGFSGLFFGARLIY